MVLLPLTNDESKLNLQFVESTQERHSLFFPPATNDLSNSYSHIACCPSEQAIWLGTSRIECGTPSQITCWQALVLPLPTNEEIWLNLSATISKKGSWQREIFVFSCVLTRIVKSSKCNGHLKLTSRYANSLVRSFSLGT